MEHPIHGTRIDEGREHPVFDFEHWVKAFPLGADPNRLSSGGWIDGPVDLAVREQAVRLAAEHGDLGPSMEADVFVWSAGVDRERPWLTRLGGKPYRSVRKRWPRAKGRPLLYLGQVCLADSADILPFDPPGEVMLVFATSIAAGHWPNVNSGWCVEFSPGELDDFDSLGSNIPWNCRLPFEYQGVIHRTRQYTDRDAYEAAFKAAGWEKGGFGIGSVQATSIGTHAHLPQTWMSDKGPRDVLLATLSSFYMHDPWPLCDMPIAPRRVRANGEPMNLPSAQGMELAIGDVGAMWVYRDARGKFKMADASH